jgi:hypothetical protein
VIWAAPTANAGMFLAEIAAGLIGPIGEPSVDAVCTENLNPDVVVMKSAKDHM